MAIERWSFQRALARIGAPVDRTEWVMAFATQLRPLLRRQENRLLLAAPWGPHP